jgi:hypothetical protein
MGDAGGTTTVRLLARLEPGTGTPRSGCGLGASAARVFGATVEPTSLADATRVLVDACHGGVEAIRRPFPEGALFPPRGLG